MSNQLNPIVLTPGQTGNVQIPIFMVAMKISNTSPYDGNFSGYGVVGDDVIPAGTEHMLYGDTYSSTELMITLVNNRNISPAPPGVILLTAYYSNSEIPKGYWPVSIPAASVNNVAVNTSKVTVVPQAQQVISNNGVINFTGSAIHILPSGGGNITGVIMQPGVNDGDLCILMSDGAGTITFATNNSNVGSGSNNVLNPGRNIGMIWNATSLQWNNHGGN